MGPYLISAIRDPNDENSGRFASGLVSDLANYLEREMSNYSGEFMTVLNEVLINAEYSTETKLHAMIAVGDICLAIEEQFDNHLDSTMTCL